MFAFGLTLPLTFPIADQQALSYNFNAGPNKVLDYLPAPHLQYHFNSKTFMQTELQVIAPQYIQSVLLYQSKKERPGGTNYRYQVNSIYAQKLYYFNLPVSIQYSPFSHFYLGTGLQFSSLLSGIALYEDKAYASLMPGSPDSLMRQSYETFRNDSVSDKLNGSEFRLMLEANYYWSRFTVGLRYNQALSNYVSIKVNNMTPYFTDKNKSIQFYLRYNLWEDRKRKKANVAMLTLK